MAPFRIEPLAKRHDRQSFDIRMLALFCVAFGALLSRLSRNPAVAPVFASTVSAWVIAVGFIRY